MDDDFTLRLRSLANAYPEDIFGPVTEAEVKEHASLITRNSAAMGRHLGKFLLEAADEIDRLERDAARLDWLEKEFERELLTTHALVGPVSLFRRNVPITRAAIDEAMALNAPEGEDRNG